MNDLEAALPGESQRWPRTTECMLGDLNSNLVVPWRQHSEPYNHPCRNKFWRFTANMTSTITTGGTGGCKDNGGGGKDKSGRGKREIMDEEDYNVHIPKTLSIVLSHVVEVQCLNLVSFYTTFSPALET
ncbi:hypothetical protein E2C01_023732 [Portunus trituberculatus]|uniref:Uncharacterized protein n=1 Tax=Portunus trituberculatus TaxID=210409 RepID=A0A5B7EBC0_PORTR|nr:hypothetical protein [Portunus trituberculatus]